MTSFDDTQKDPSTMNQWTDFWHYKIGINIFPLDSNKKTYENWSQYQGKAIPDEIHEEWKRECRYSKGLILMPGKVWRGENKGLYFVGIDFDKELGLKEFCNIIGANNSIDELKEKFIVEQHAKDPYSLHLYFYSEIPFTDKSPDRILSIEIKSNGKGLMCATPSYHSKTDSIWQIKGTDSPIILKSEEALKLMSNINDICGKYNVSYLKIGKDDSSSSVYLSPLIKQMITSLEINSDIIIQEGARHDTLLSIANSLLIQHNHKIKENLKDFFIKVNDIICSPPLPQNELMRIWQSALEFSERIIKDFKVINNDQEDYENYNKPIVVPLQIGEELQKEDIIESFVKDNQHNNLILEFNHKYPHTKIPVPITGPKKWLDFRKSVKQMLEEYEVREEHIKLILKTLDSNYDLIIDKNNSSSDLYSSSDKEEEKPKWKFVTHKYSQIGKEDLYEAVFIDGRLPVFIKYNDKTNEFEKTEQIEERTRILVPPAFEECPYLSYEFENVDEINSINKFIENNNIDLNYFYYKGYEIVSKYNNQSRNKLRLATIKIITSHFQDRFPTTEYLYPVGGNGSGKSSLAETFRAIAYKAVVMTDPTAPNLFRLLGVVEPVQCTMILEEADKIDKSSELMAFLKTGSSYYGMVPKINPYTLKQEFFYTYCPKIIVSERSLNQSVAKGVSSRTFPINCIKGVARYDIKEVLNPTNTGGPENKKLFYELIEFRKLLLIYRLRHFKDPIPDLDIGVEGRDKELVKHSIQLFYNCKCLNEVTETLQEFLNLKNEKKESSIESILLSIVSTLVKHNGPKISSKIIWEELMAEIPGILNEKNPNEYNSDDYGTIYRTTTVSTYLGDSFGGRVKHGNKGNIWIFDREVIESLAKEDKTRITISESKTKEEGEVGEGVNTVNTPDRGGSIKLEKSKGEEEKEEEKQNNNNNNILGNFSEMTKENITKNLDPLTSDAFTPFTYSPSSNDNNRELFNNPLISESDLSIGGPYDPEIINNITRYEKSDRWFCNNCTMKDDKWGMMKHHCRKNNNKKNNNGDLKHN